MITEAITSELQGCLQKLSPELTKTPFTVSLTSAVVVSPLVNQQTAFMSMCHCSNRPDLAVRDVTEQTVEVNSFQIFTDKMCYRASLQDGVNKVLSD